MNRDEYRGRIESNTIHEKDGIYYPIDKQAGGTWFGFNHQGTVMALLNRYQDKAIETTTTRGDIIPNLLKSKNISVDLDKLLVNKYNPFDLIIINHAQIIQCSWSGKKLTKLVKSLPFFVSSSSIDAYRVQKYRAKAFLNFNAINPNQILSDLHLSQDSKDTSCSIYMSRKKTHTKSISQVTVTAESLNYQYLTEEQLSSYDRQTQSQNLQLKLAS
jgi:uncharacterized protein with NRDE domain